MTAVWTIGQHAGRRHPPLERTVDADVVVIGGGITGLTTALRLHEAGKRVVLLEAFRAGEGNTGGSTGNLYGTVSQGLARVRRKWDDATVRQVADLRMQALARIEATAGRLAIDCDFARRPLYFCTRTPDQAQTERIEAEHEASLAAGLAAELTASVPHLPFTPHRALRIERQAQLNPLAYAQGLAAALSEQGVAIYEDSRAIGVDARQGTVKTDHGDVRAEHIVFATHTPKGVNLVQAEMVPYREHGISARLDGKPGVEGICWILDDARSVRSYRHQGQDYLVVVGEKHKTGHGSRGHGFFESLRAYAHSQFGVTDFLHEWSAQQYHPADELPYIGHSGHHNVYLATGFAADGLVWGTVAADLIAEQIQGRDSDAARLLSPRRFTPTKSVKGWMEESAMVAEHFAKDYLSSAELKGTENIPQGEGRIVQLAGEKLAVYRGLDNRLSVLSPVCPHMKCLVVWNAADSTWDCPCHGSRFTTDGSVLEGPAFHSLRQRAPKA